MFKNKIIYGVLALLVGFAISFSTVNAQVTTGEEERETMNQFEGKVIDASTGQPLSDVTVRVQDQEVTTDQEGIFQLDNLSEEGSTTEGMGQTGGEITVEIEHEGYETFSETVHLESLRSHGQQQGQQQQGQQQGNAIMTFELQPQESDY